jgi:Putative peptidoglycan-binding domain-containing protein
MFGKPSSPTKGSDAATPRNATTTLCPLIKKLLRIRLIEGKSKKSKILDNHAYELIIDGLSYKGTTDKFGILEQDVAETAQSATLNFDDISIDLILEKEFPTEKTIRGIQARLNNLGYNCGDVDGKAGKATKASIRAFQKDHPPLDPNSTPSGASDPKTQNKLASEHGC